jgi:hypothetical protein
MGSCDLYNESQNNRHLTVPQMKDIDLRLFANCTDYPIKYRVRHRNVRLLETFSGTVVGYGLDDWGSRVRFLAGKAASI